MAISFRLIAGLLLVFISLGAASAPAFAQSLVPSRKWT